MQRECGGVGVWRACGCVWPRRGPPLEVQGCGCEVVCKDIGFARRRRAEARAACVGVQVCRTGPEREVNTSGAGDRYACIVEERVVATDGWQLLAAAAAALPLTAASSSIDPALSGYLLPLNHLWPVAAAPTCASCQVE